MRTAQTDPAQQKEDVNESNNSPAELSQDEGVYSQTCPPTVENDPTGTCGDTYSNLDNTDLAYDMYDSYLAESIGISDQPFAAFNFQPFEPAGDIGNTNDDYNLGEAHSEEPETNNSSKLANSQEIDEVVRYVEVFPESSNELLQITQANCQDSQPSLAPSKQKLASKASSGSPDQTVCSESTVGWANSYHLGSSRGRSYVTSCDWFHRGNCFD